MAYREYGDIIPGTEVEAELAGAEREQEEC